MYDFQFKLYDDANVIDGNQVGSDVNVPDVDVIDGYFTVVLEFGSDVFNGDARWLEIEVRQADSNDPNDFIALNPRQEVTPTPYALQTRGIFVDGAGNVGIGTDIPFERLEVDHGNLLVRGTESFDSADEESFVFLGDNNHYIKSGWGFGVSIGTWGVDPAIVVRETTGHVGIGTIDPQKNLSIQSTRPQIALVESGGGAGVLEFHEQENQLRLQYWTDYGSTWDTTMMTLDGDTGRVGIGTDNPGAKLDVRSSSTNSDVIEAHASDGSELFNVIELYNGDGAVHIKDRTGTYKIKLSSSGYSFFNGGNVGIGDVGVPLKKLVVRGNILVKSESTGADVLELGQGLDYAEGFDVTESTDIEPGTVLVIDSENPGKLRVGQSAYDSKVAGIVAGANGMGSGVRLGVGQFDYDVALAGRVYCKVDATEEAVHAGDQLTTSETPGHAMKATDYDRARGAVLGKAMESLEKGKKGKILVLETLQ
jgi:hypothetical protein